jgi:hypothetical protein
MLTRRESPDQIQPTATFKASLLAIPRELDALPTTTRYTGIGPCAPAGPVCFPIDLPWTGRSGENVKFLTGPPNSAVKSIAPGRVFVTNARGRVILDITGDRVKEVRPQVGFVGEKRQFLTAHERI